MKKILDPMQVIETAIIQAGEIEKRGDYAGAWETIEKVYKENPDDSKLEIGSSLAWYLKARRIYPASAFAQNGINRLVKRPPGIIVGAASTFPVDSPSLRRGLRVAAHSHALLYS